MTEKKPLPVFGEQNKIIIKKKKRIYIYQETGKIISCTSIVTIKVTAAFASVASGICRLDSD